MKSIIEDLLFVKLHLQKNSTNTQEEYLKIKLERKDLIMILL